MEMVYPPSPLPFLPLTPPVLFSPPSYDSWSGLVSPVLPAAGGERKPAARGGGGERGGGDRRGGWDGGVTGWGMKVGEGGV